MKKRFPSQLFIFLSIGMLLVQSCQPKKETIELWYNKPASNWEEALPIGNGRLGAMIYGTPAIEHIQFNEETLWDGAPRDYHQENSYQHLSKIRTLLFEGKQDEAEKLAGETFMGRRAYEKSFQIKKEAWADSLLQLSKVKEGVLPSYNDELWKTMLIDNKSVWERKGLPDMNGSLLFRKTVEIPTEWKGKTLSINLGKIKDHDFTYFNGHLIGSKDESNTNRTYTIPANLVKPGKNVIAVLINNYVSTGGFNAVRKAPHKMHIIPKGNSSDPLFIEGDWKYIVVDKKPPYYLQYQAEYQPFGDLKIAFEGHDSFNNFRRNLNLSNALAAVSYEVDGVKYEREYLASQPDNLIAVKFSANKKGKISFFLKLYPSLQHMLFYLAL